MTLDDNPILYSDHDQHHIHGKGTCLTKGVSKFLIGQKPMNEWTITAPIKTRKKHCYH